MLKRIICAVLTAVFVLCLCGCSQKNYSQINGYDDIAAARKLYTELFSAHLTVTDKSTGALTQEFFFRYDKNEILTYSYFGTDGNNRYYEFHNGSEYCFTDENGEWQELHEGDEQYAVFTRSKKMSIADEGIIFLKGDNILSSEVSGSSDNKTIKFIYDAEALNSSMSSQLGQVGKLTEFSVTYTLDKYGRCTSMEQIGKATQDGESFSVVDYLLVIDLMNDVSEITKPEIK